MRPEAWNAAVADVPPDQAHATAAPVSIDQEMLWLSRPDTARDIAFNVCRYTVLPGRVDRELLLAALREVVDRHEPLRTRFDTGPAAAQHVMREGIVDLPVIDLGSSDRAEVAALLEREARAPFDVASGRLLRTSLIRLTPDQHVLGVMIHHTVTDWVSYNVFFEELIACYEARALGRPAGRPVPRSQHAAFAAWQREMVGTDDFERTRSWWLARLDGAVDALGAAGFQRTASKPGLFDSRIERFRLEPELAQELKTLTKQARATMFMSTLALFALLLRAETSSEDLTIATPVANRDFDGAERSIGYFMGYVFIRIDLSGDPSFVELLRRVRAATLDAFAHALVPVGTLLSDLPPHGNPWLHPLFQVRFLFLTPRGIPSRSGIGTDVRNVENGAAPFSLTFALFDRVDGVTGRCDYNLQAFDRDSALRFIDRYVRLAMAATTAADMPLSRVLATAQANRLGEMR